MDQNKVEIFEVMPVPKAVSKLVIPTVLSQFVIMIYNLADTFFVGQTGDPNQVAAVSLSFPLYMMLSVLSNLFGIGGGSLISRFMGAKDMDDVKHTSAFSFYTCIGVATVFGIIVFIFMRPLLYLLGASDNTYGFARDYIFYVLVVGALPTSMSMILGHLFRSEGAAKISSIGIALGGVLNIILDPIFIFGLNMKVAGAALATMIANAISAIYYLIMLHRLKAKTVISILPTDYKIKKEIVRPVFSVGLPAALASGLSCVSNMVVNHLISGYGDIQVAALGIVKKIDTIPLNTCLGISQGTLPLIAYNYSAKNYQRMKEVSRFARLISAVFAVVCIIVFEVFSEPFIRLFINEPETIALGAEFLRIACLATPVIGISFLMNIMFQAMGKGLQSLILTSCRQGIINIPLLFIMRAAFGLYGIVWTQLISDTLTVIIAFILYRGLLQQLHREEAEERLRLSAH